MHDVEGCSIREIMRRTGYHYETVKKYVDMEDFNSPPQPPTELPSLLDPLKPIIDKWLQDDLKAPRKQRHTAKRIFERLQNEHGDELEVKLRTIQYYVSNKKKDLYIEKSKGRLPLEHPPGEAQVDFGAFAYYDNTNTMREGRKLTVSFPYSNAAYCQVFKGENQECLLQGLKNVIEHINKVPSRMVFDNLSAAVAHMGKGKNRILTDGFKRFMQHYRIEPDFCNGAAGWEKGNVENKVGYERRNMFVPVPTILEFDIFNRKLFSVCEKDMIREHYKRGQLISELFKLDLNSMFPLNSNEYIVSKIQSAKADNYGKIMFETNHYSTSPKLAQEKVILEIGSNTVKIMDSKYKHIVTHERLYCKNGEAMDWIPYISLMAKRPTAIKYTSFYNNLPEVWQNYLSELTSEEKREALLTLNKILETHSMMTAADALEIALDRGVRDADSILASYHSLTKRVQQMQPMQLQNPSMNVPSFKIDTVQYDALFKGGSSDER